MKNIVYVILAETRLSGNFNIYPEVKADLQEAFDYAETYCSVLIDKLVSEKGYSPDSCSRDSCASSGVLSASR